MNVHRSRPACWTDGEPTPRAEAFFDRGRSCGQAASPATWAAALFHTPGCKGCSRARRGLDVSAGVVAPDRPVRRVKAVVRRTGEP